MRFVHSFCEPRLVRNGVGGTSERVWDAIEEGGRRASSRSVTLWTESRRRYGGENSWNFRNGCCGVPCEVAWILAQTIWSTEGNGFGVAVR